MQDCLEPDAATARAWRMGSDPCCDRVQPRAIASITVAHVPEQVQELALQLGSRQMRDRRLQAVEAVVKWQQGVPAEGENDRLIFNGEHGEARVLGTHPGTAVLLRLRHFCIVVELTP